MQLLLPLLTLCPLLAQVHCTVSPTWMLNVAGLNTSIPLGPTTTVCIAGVAIGEGVGVGTKAGQPLSTLFTALRISSMLIWPSPFASRRCRH